MNINDHERIQVMDVEKLEDLAFRGEPMPELRSHAQCLLYQAFRNLYDYAKRVYMPPEQGKREKHEIIRAYKVNRFLEELGDSTVKMWKRIELAAADYAKNPSVKTADELYEAIFSAKRKGSEKQ